MLLPNTTATMALNIARLLNCAQSDRDELNALLDEHMIADDSDTDLTSDDDFGHDSSDDEQNFDFRDNDFDTAMATADSLDSTEIVMDVAEDELKKSTAFRYVACIVLVDVSVFIVTVFVAINYVVIHPVCLPISQSLH